MKEKRKAFYKVCFSYWFNERFKPWVKMFFIKAIDVLCVALAILFLAGMLALGIYALAVAVSHW